MPNDSLGYLEDLHDALADSALRDVTADGSATPDGAAAAYRLALSLGCCRLFGVVPDEDLPEVLPPHVAIAAATWLADRLPEWIEKANRLGDAWDDVSAAAEADDLCIGLLKRRNWAWAVDLAVGEAYVRASSQGEPAAVTLAAAIDRMRGALDRFDAALADQLEILSTLCGTNWLANVRADLAPEFREDLPWWLDGRLEAIARRIEEKVSQAVVTPGVVRPRLATQEPSIPACEPDLRLAADMANAPVMPGKTLSWVSPGGVWRAVLRVPKPLTKSEEEKSRSLRFVRVADEAPASDLKDEPVRFGNEPADPPRIDSEGEVEVRLSDLRKIDLRRLRVGDPPVEWKPE